jgi:flavin reductase (DIM6/NTAB) family NADH-FMN oxidoreductase RutF
MEGEIMKKSLGAKTIIYPTPVLVIGTYDSQNKPNLMTVAWGGICCSNPPCVAISLRKATYTYNNIMEKKAFTVNILSEDMVKEADYYGIVSGRDEDKFTKTNITPVKSDLVDAPYGKEFPFVVECKLFKSLEIGLHTQFIGEILDVKAEESILGTSGFPDMDKLKPFFFDPAGSYYFRTGKMLAKGFSIGKEI